MKNNKAFKLFTLYLLLISLINLSSVIVGKVFHLNNLYFSHFYFIIQFIFLSLFYVELLKRNWIRWILIIVLIMVGFQYVVEPMIFFKYNAIGMSLTHSILVLFSLLYLYKSLSGRSEFMYANIGIFFYLLSSTLIFASGNLVFNLNISQSLIQLLTDINAVLYVIFHILVYMEWKKNYRQPIATDS